MIKKNKTVDIIFIKNKLSIKMMNTQWNMIKIHLKNMMNVKKNQLMNLTQEFTKLMTQI